MSDGQSLLLVLWLIYLSDCFLWLDLRMTAFTACWDKDWKRAFASKWFANASGGLLFLNPLPPFGRFCLSRPIPVSISPEAVTAWNSETPGSGNWPDSAGATVPISDIQEVSARNGELRLNGEPFCKGHEEDIREIAELLATIKALAPEERATAIETFWERRLNPAHAAEEQARLDIRSESLRNLATVQFTCLFILLPGLTLLYGVSRLLIPGAVGMVILAVAVCVKFFRLHRALYPASKGDRISEVVKMALCPPASIRAVDPLMKNAHARRHSLTLACMLLPDDRRDAFVRTVLRNLRHPVFLGSSHETVANVCQWQNDTIERLAAQCLPPVARCLEDLDEAPDQQAPECVSYCPRCLMQFSFMEADCPDCPGVQVVPFPSRHASHTT